MSHQLALQPRQGVSSSGAPQPAPSYNIVNSEQLILYLFSEMGFELLAVGCDAAEDKMLLPC